MVESDEAPFGPGDEEEAHLGEEDRAGQRSADASTDAPKAGPVDHTPPEPLETLVARIPAATRAALDEQLRARFMRVRRLREGELK